MEQSKGYGGSLALEETLELVSPPQQGLVISAGL
jgi:hypothetical protein